MSRPRISVQTEPASTPEQQADYLIRHFEEDHPEDALRIRRWQERLHDPAVRQAIALTYRHVRAGKAG